MKLVGDAATPVRLGVAVALLALGLGAWQAARPAPARADGDPASDVLFADDVFVTYRVAPSDPRVDALAAQVAASPLPLKVAVVYDAQDMGAVPVLLGKPATYARFLGAEILGAAKGSVVIVVMPDGIGVAPVAADDTGAVRRAALARSRLAAHPVRPGSAPDALMAAATRAVAVVAGAPGVATAPATGRLPRSPARSTVLTRHPVVVALALAAAALLLTVLATYAWLVRERQRQQGRR